MSERDKGAVQHADSNGDRLDKGAVEANVVSGGGTVVPALDEGMLVGGLQALSGGLSQ